MPMLMSALYGAHKCFFLPFRPDNAWETDVHGGSLSVFMGPNPQQDHDVITSFNAPRGFRLLNELLCKKGENECR